MSAVALSFVPTARDRARVSVYAHTSSSRQCTLSRPRSNASRRSFVSERGTLPNETLSRARSVRASARFGVIALANVLGDGSSSTSEDADDSDDEETTRASVQLPRTRRRVQMTFTCNKCEGRTMRMINPDVLERGTMWVQCGECEVWHQIVDNLGLIFDFTGDYDELKNVVKNAMRMRPQTDSD
ncbi:Mitochondrial import protein TIM15 [Ostreococcus tauri]|uniref:ETCHED1 protein n=1 Tax=Ostreococcus tauri TaxID=70448 RepID=Q00U85_OSTTA|nr:Mitochondrial import protein TIM15 [Ostreococcus tauri]OUS44309.1 ETCHED1 protein [Ostreococcus tauri]CAL58164.1 Mitochondrial import protein TIM15 [Ostreococcus tauri]|eukprot:XP_003083615.1 Mitochondrial import protein TIM15 [Ostreococcus tauri]